MKKLIHIYWTLALLLSMSSCSTNDTPVFDSTYSALNIWFRTSNLVLDSTTYNYSYSLEEGTLTFIARIAGLPADYDRTFTLEAVRGDVSEAEGSFQTDVYTLKAGEVEIECPIRFNTSRLKNAASFTVRDGHLYFRLAQNKEFVEGTENMQELVVVLKNYLAKPDNWETAVYPYYALGNIFGEYRKEKYQFMIQILGLREFSINRSATVPYDTEKNEVSYNYANYLKEKMIVALEEYKANHNGEPLRDANGDEITF